MMHLTLKQLRYFDAVARHRHFGQAAEACAISQPALSMQIKELEESLGSALLERGARQIRLTGLGEDFHARVREILRSVDELADLARSREDGFMGRLRLGVIPTIGPYLLPSVVKNLMDSYQGLDVHIRETQTATLIRELKEGRLDAAIVALPISEPGLAEVALFSEEFILVRHRDDANKPVPDLEDMQQMKLLLLEEGHCFRDQALSFCNIQAGVAREVMDGSSLSTLVQMVSAGIGITLIPEMAVDVETRSASVSISRFDTPKPTRTVGMVWRQTSPLISQFTEISSLVSDAATGRGANLESV